MSVKVTFTYDEETRKWDPVVHGTSTLLEAQQAFNAVVLSCQMLKPELLEFSKVEILVNGVRIVPAV